MKAKQALLVLIVGLAGVASAVTLNMEWAYHDDADGMDRRATDPVPGEGFTFLEAGSASVADAATVTLYVLTANQFAGDREEQIHLRWWNGEGEHWIAGEWVKNIHLGEGDQAVGAFKGFPQQGQETVDLWKFVAAAEVTRPGENFYVIQMKSWDEAGVAEYYLLREAAGEFGGRNALGQAWTASPDYFGKDWSITVTE